MRSRTPGRSISPISKERRPCVGSGFCGHSYWLACIFCFLVAGTMCSGFARVDTRPTQTGRVLAAGMSGHGKNSSATSRRWGKGDLWWNYCIAWQSQVYSVVSRESPAKTGLAVDTKVRFSVDKKQMFVLDPGGKRHALRILRQLRADACP